MRSSIAVALLGGLVAVSPADAAGPSTPPPVVSPPAAPSLVVPGTAEDDPLVYIFSGALTGGETYSGTLVAASAGPEFELKLGTGATCDNDKLEPDKGLVRLPQTVCSDGRSLKALFVYQAGGILRVYGSVGDQRFSAQAHALSGETEKAAPPPAASPPANLMDK